jgi:F-type H+-transporting ATPase subunit a
MSAMAPVAKVPWPPSTKDFFTPGYGNSVWFTKFPILVWFAVAILIVFFLVAYRRPKLVPTFGQWLAESLYGFIREGVAKEILGAEGVRFAPYLATLFSFVLLTNLFGLVPGIEISPNAHIAFPAALAAISFGIYLYMGIRKFGFWGYWKQSLFPPGVPWPLYILLTPIELLQVLAIRPVTLAVRLFANMFAGHLILLVFTLGGFVLFATNNIALAALGVVSLAMAIVMTFFELIVAVLQAYVFTLLTAVFVQLAIAEEH